MDSDKLNNQRFHSEGDMQVEQEEDMQKQEAVEQPENNKQTNFLQNNQTQSIKSFISERVVYKVKKRPLLLRPRSEKSNSELQLSSISSKFAHALQQLTYARNNCKTIQDKIIKLIGTLDYCFRNNLCQKRTQFIQDMLSETQRQLDEERQRLKRAETQFSKLEEVYEKQKLTHQKLLMQRHMI